ncbi:hypothetical protein [Sporosarcina sp. FA9]|uniref:hypothetical protein n=1 Tax=Sporosarcina sp. FA9 TaxID=3413030 RepID=UPI003F6583BF
MNFSYKYLFITILVSLLSGIFSYFYLPLHKITGIEKALEGILLLSSISLGFYGACLSVFASIFNTPVVKELMNDKEYRKEFLVVASASLISGFLTVSATIVYQVMMANETLGNSVLRITNSFWIAITLLFLSFNLLFVLVSFLIFFSNTEEAESPNVHNGEVNGG